MYVRSSKNYFLLFTGIMELQNWTLVSLQHFLLQTCMTASARLSAADEDSLIAHFLCGIFNKMPMNVTMETGDRCLKARTLRIQSLPPPPGCPASMSAETLSDTLSNLQLHLIVWLPRVQFENKDSKGS